MSGRGLGHTGGTLDKLESIPGFDIELTQEQFLRQVSEVGLAIIGQTADLVPADKRLYGLRDVTGTVDSIPLIASSIMSKKIAAGADAIVLDVKVGDGAFMKTLERARELARTMVELGREAGREVVCELTDMDQPLGHAVGNALEIREAVATVRGEGPPDVTELVVSAASHLLALSDLGVDAAEGGDGAQEAVDSGAALEAYERWIRAQGGDPDPDRLPSASVVRSVEASDSGHVEAIAATRLGLAALRLGAGPHAEGRAGRPRRRRRLPREARRRGRTSGEAIAEVHAADPEAAEAAVPEVAACYRSATVLPSPSRSSSTCCAERLARRPPGCESSPASPRLGWPRAGASRGRDDSLQARARACWASLHAGGHRRRPPDPARAAGGSRSRAGGRARSPTCVVAASIWFSSSRVAATSSSISV